MRYLGEGSGDYGQFGRIYEVVCTVSTLWITNLLGERALVSDCKKGKLELYQIGRYRIIENKGVSLLNGKFACLSFVD